MTFSNRTTAYAGLVTLGLMIVSFLLSGTPPALDDPNADIVEYVIEDETLHRASAFFGLLVSVPFALFVIGLMAIFRGTGGSGQSASWMLFFGVVVIGIGAIGGQVAVAAATIDGGAGFSEGSIRALFNLSAIGYTSVGAGIAIVGIATFLVARDGGLFPDWFQWFSVLVVALGIVGLFGLIDAGTAYVASLLGFLGFLLWTAGTSFLVLRTTGGFDE